MNLPGYLDVTNDKKLAWDVKLGLDHDKYNVRYNWNVDPMPNINDTSIIDECVIDRKWIDGEIDVSDIPPSIFFLGVINCYSAGLGLYIPLDESFADFSKRIANFLPKYRKDSIWDPNWGYKYYIPYFSKDYIDLEYLNRTGKIRSVKQWNTSATRDGKICFIEADDNPNEIEVIGSIQEIVFKCRKFYESNSIV